MDLLVLSLHEFSMVCGSSSQAPPHALQNWSHLNWSAWAITGEHHGLGGVNNRHFFSLSSGREGGD